MNKSGKVEINHQKRVKKDSDLNDGRLRDIFPPLRLMQDTSFHHLRRL